MEHLGWQLFVYWCPFTHRSHLLGHKSVIGYEALWSDVLLEKLIPLFLTSLICSAELGSSRVNGLLSLPATPGSANRRHMVRIQLQTHVVSCPHNDTDYTFQYVPQTWRIDKLIKPCVLNHKRTWETVFLGGVGRMVGGSAYTNGYQVTPLLIKIVTLTVITPIYRKVDFLFLLWETANKTWSFSTKSQ